MNMHRLFKSLLLISSLQALQPQTLVANEAPKPNEEEFQKLFDSLQFHAGQVEIGQDLGTLNLGPHFLYLNPRDSEIVLHKFWNNPPGSKSLGMILPNDESLRGRNSWGIVVSFEEHGYVSDEDAEKIDYEALLKDMQNGLEEQNEARKSSGYESVNLLGWAEAPRYDKDQHVLYWAKRLQFEKAGEETLNYNIRVLGRHGVLNLNVVGSMEQLPLIKLRESEILAMARFKEGKRYEDYRKGDRVAAYGLAALISGGVLAKKAGLFKVLLTGLLASKKLLAGLFVAAMVFLRRLLRLKA